MLHQPILLNEFQASEATGFKVATLRKRRWAGKPPQFLKVGRKVFYDDHKIKEFMASCVRYSTSQKEAPKDLEIGKYLKKETL